MFHARLFKRWIGLGALAVAMVAGSTQSHGIVSTFTGGDPGEGLDLQGNFLYAVNTRGPGGLKVGDAFFTTDQNNATAGYSHNAGAEILNWANPNYGGTTNDDNLEVIMQSIRHGAPAQQHQINLSNLIVGREYKLQLLFTESCCNRGFDVSVNGTLVADNFNIQATQGGINANPTNGAVVSHSFIAGATTANILFNGPGAGFPDPNPTISALTLEDTSGLALAPFNVALNKPATATSTYPAGQTFAASKAVDGVTSDAQQFQWLSADGVTSASLTIDLLGGFDVSEFQLLNTANAGFQDRATGTFSIDVAGPDGVFRNVLSPRTLQGFAAGFQSEFVALGNVQFVRYNMLSITDPDNGGPFPLAGGGLNEIRVIGTAAVPEPATALMGVFGLAGLALRRRRVA
jgi:MYXO-CTERM domain-containing protein